MTLRPVLVVLACVGAAAGCGAPTSPTSTPSRASTPPAASLSGATASPSPGTSSTPGSISVDSAAVIEFQYPGYPGWYYAPQMRVTETSGNGFITITGAEFSIPGQTPWECSTGQVVSAGRTLELFPEIYGDYPLTFDNPGARSSGDVLIVLHLRDPLGLSSTLSVTAPITPGSLPSSNTGGAGTWSSCRAAGQAGTPDRPWGG